MIVVLEGSLVVVDVVVFDGAVAGLVTVAVIMDDEVVVGVAVDVDLGVGLAVTVTAGAVIVIVSFGIEDTEE